MDHKKDPISVGIAYRRLDAPTSIPVHHAVRNDIQSLRALAIVFVLLFHMWPSKIRFGYLGVDMFFVISGYLIFMLLSRRKPLDFQKTLDFYFRRIKRIVPIYLFVVFLILFAILEHISSIEFTQIADEVIPALGFYSNMPSVRPFKYFDLSSKLYFFLHTWSLSVEIQFYITVPLFFFLFEFIGKFRPILKFLLISTVPLLSFLHQSYTSGDTSHMLLSARLWQFFSGFFAHYAYENRLLDIFKVGQNVENRQRAILDECLSTLFFSLLALFFIFGFNECAQFDRFIVILLTALIVGRFNENSTLLNNKLAVLIGDTSYSIYLVHWPIFTYHRYANMSMYVDGMEADLMTGLTLITASMLIGYLIEKLFKLLLKQIDSWSFLIIFLLFGYYINGMLVYQLRSKAIDLNNAESENMPPDWEKKLREDVLMLYNERSSMPNYTHDEITAFNAENIHAYSTFAFCDNQNRQMPTRFPLNMSSYDLGTSYTCHTKGNGTKNIVLIGNSHAMHNFPGIQYQFRNIYKRLTMFARNSCLPTSKKFQQPDRSKQVKDECMRLLNETILALQQWQEPVDIIIAFYALVDGPDVPLPVDMKTDEFFTSMQEFYSTLGKIPTEALILYENFPLFSQNAISEVSARIKSGKPLDTIGDKKEALMNRLITMRKRSEMIHCEKCIKLKLIDNWCEKGNNSFCHSTQNQGLIYFADWHHPSAYGSFFNAHYMINLYEKFMGKRKLG